MTGSAVLSLADVGSDTVAGLWLNVYRCLEDKEAIRGMTVCKTFKAVLPSTLTVISCRTAVVSQRSLECFSKIFANLRELQLKQNYDRHAERSGELDFSTSYLPELCHLSLYDCPLMTIEFNQTNTPQLQLLHVHNIRNPPRRPAAAIELDLPELTSLSLEVVNVSLPASCQAARLCNDLQGTQ